MRITKHTLRVAAWMALIASAGYVLAVPLFLGLVLVESRVSAPGGAGTGAIFLLALPAFFLLRWLKKKPYFQERLTLTEDESRMFLSFGWGSAGCLFLVFIFNLSWFYAHDTARMISGLIVLWLTIFGVLPSIATMMAPKK